MAAPRAGSDDAALRAIVSGAVQGVGFRDATRRRARSLGIRGWVRNRDDGGVELHAEGPQEGLDALLAYLREGPRSARVASVEATPAKVEGHEQFAIRGISAGGFSVRRAREGRGFELCLEVAGGSRRWLLPRGPSLDPAAKRLAVELQRGSSDDAHAGRGDRGGARESDTWDDGPYEQGGRVPWPEALARGHAVFVLHGHRLRGGFALQRTHAGEPAEWLLVKRRDEHARPGSDVLAEAATDGEP